VHTVKWRLGQDRCSSIFRLRDAVKPKPGYFCMLDGREISQQGWRFWIDRGGTFTDVIGQSPDSTLHFRKVLTDSASRTGDAAQSAIREILGIDPEAPLKREHIAEIRVGTTVATNALLERKGDPTVLLITEGFADALRIGYQSRPDIFALNIRLPPVLYSRVVEVSGRVDAEGRILRPLDGNKARGDLIEAYKAGFRAVAIVLIHGYKYTAFERQLGDIAREVGFTQITLSHQASPLRKLVPRGDTAVLDAYTSPPLQRYVSQITRDLDGVPLQIMKSDGGLTDAATVRGMDALLSGPAAGVVACARTAKEAGFPNVIGFDMGGTSTDVCHYAGVYERAGESLISGVRVQVPMMSVHTVAAGGGSILRFDGHRFQVGPDSAGADPGPACYRRGGPLTLTDCNVLLGKLQPQWFPAIFGPRGNERLDEESVTRAFAELAARVETATGRHTSPHAVAEGFLRVAVDSMAHAIKRVSVEKGYDIQDYALNCFGGAGGQHACLVADAVGIRSIIVHRLASVLSAYGIGLTTVTARRVQALEQLLCQDLLDSADRLFYPLEDGVRSELRSQKVPDTSISIERRMHLKYSGTDTTIELPFDGLAELRSAFSSAHIQHFGFDMVDRALIVEYVSVEASQRASATLPYSTVDRLESVIEPKPLQHVQAFVEGQHRSIPIYDLGALPPGQKLMGPCIVRDAISTIVVEPGWSASQVRASHLILSRVGERPIQAGPLSEAVDPVMLEVFHNAFQSVAQQMGQTLQKTSRSVNIKERLDFSCAVFDAQGNLIANAPHIPVHLGSMSGAVRSVIQNRGQSIRPGDSYMLNDPYQGGTHLPDITVVTPVFSDSGPGILFFVAGRAHHADIGGRTPGSMPPNSQYIQDEGILIRDFHLVDGNGFREEAALALFSSGPFPSRNPGQNIADLRAQVAANTRGIQELHKLLVRYGTTVVLAYVRHLESYAEEQTRAAIAGLSNGSFQVKSDDGSQITVSISIDKQSRSATIDFSGTSAQQKTNFNAPRAITDAAVLYVFRTLLDAAIPLNEGCLRPLRIVVPHGSMLDPLFPAAVVAGNVEVSQCVTDCLYGALGILASAQGTMNNFTFGNDRYQHYETLCGGAGAGRGFNGASGVHTHMTNSRLTDPEILEANFPVILESFVMRSGSGGQGMWRGGEGTRRRIRFRDSMSVSLLANRHIVPPFGLHGGEPGACGHCRIERSDGSVITLTSRASATVGAGDCIVIETPGGGGYGKRDAHVEHL
jgi:5-oxoprolinase (ATP-hydrolysing)